MIECKGWNVSDYTLNPLKILVIPAAPSTHRPHFVSDASLLWCIYFLIKIESQEIPAAVVSFELCGVRIVRPRTTSALCGPPPGIRPLPDVGRHRSESFLPLHLTTLHSLTCWLEPESNHSQSTLKPTGGCTHHHPVLRAHLSRTLLLTSPTNGSTSPLWGTQLQPCSAAPNLATQNPHFLFPLPKFEPS